MMISLLFRVCTAVLVITACGRGVHAQATQQPSRTMMNRYRFAAETTAATVRAHIRALLSYEQRQVLDRLVVVVDTNSWDVRGISAGVDDDPPTIRIPLGLVYLLDYVDSAVAAAELGGVSTEVLVAYISAVTQHVRDAQARPAFKSRAITGLPDFPTFVGWSSVRWARIAATTEYRSRKDLIKLSSFAFVFIHEFSHHLHPADSLEVREINADRLAAKLASRTEYNGMLAFPFFMFFAALEGDQSLHVSKVGYPAPLCRGLVLFDSGWLKTSEDADFVRYMKSGGLWSKWQQLPEAVHQVLRSENVRCSEYVEAREEFEPKFRDPPPFPPVER